MSTAPNYDSEYLANLFDRMGPTYDIVNVVTSFGFCNVWRRQCVAGARLGLGAEVADLMAGSGECWPYLLPKIGPEGKIHSVDFSNVMSDRQRKRQAKHGLPQVEVRHEMRDVRCWNEAHPMNRISQETHSYSKHWNRS